jgi:uncharacterized FlaG/YvyC family protein
MIADIQPLPARESASRGVPPAQAATGKEVPSRGADQPVAAPAAVAPPDRTRSVEVLNRYLARSQRSLQFVHDPDAGQTIILVVDPASGEVLRQIPAKERVALARWIALSRPTVIDLRA